MNVSVTEIPGFVTAFLTALVLIGGCTTSGPAAEEKREGTRSEIDLSNYENFDPRPYREQSPSDQVRKIEHQVPKALMDGQVGAGRLVKQQGFRIQIFSSINRDEASSKRDQFADWWEKQRKKSKKEDSGLSKLNTYLKYKQPYYRIQIGNFTSRSQAQQLLKRIKEKFSSAFLAPATVTVQR